MSGLNVSEITNRFLLGDKVLEALQFTRHYTARNPDDAEGWYWLGVSLIFRRDYFAARRALETGRALEASHLDINFGLAAVHYAMGNYQLARERMSAFAAEASGRQISEDEMLGRAAMLSSAKAFRAALFFLEFLKTCRPAPSIEIDGCIADIWNDMEDYALKEKPRLGDKWLELYRVRPQDKSYVRGIVLDLVADLSWGDAVYLYKKYLGEICAGCPQSGRDKVCLYCLSDEIMPPPHILFQ
jgi:tetratricopeptide (TPR) repeat protein